MRAFVCAVLATVALLTVAPASAGTGRARGSRAAASTLQTALSQGIQAAGSSSGAYVVDLTTGRQLFGAAGFTERLPASVEKVYTTSTALLRFGSNARMQTSIFGRGVRGPYGTWHGTLFLRGGGDPTFGSASFDANAYGSGGTMQRLVANFVRQNRITALKGSIIGDESYFDSLRGTAPYGFQLSGDIEGELSALAYDRGLADEQGTSFAFRPALFAAQQLAGALQAAGVNVPGSTPIRSGVTPSDATALAIVNSPRLATLIGLTNTPSDNFFAEMLLKGLGAKFGGRGTSAAGAAVVRAQLARWGVHPQLEDGSGLSRNDLTSPRQVVTVLEQMAHNPDFFGSLAIAGETGTLASEMNGTVAQGNCRGKTGTLHDVSNLVGYCHARDGHTLAFAFLMNSVDPYSAHPIQNQMAVALANYNG